MAARDPASWLPSALLLLWVPGCWCLQGPFIVTGYVGGSLSVPCPYEKEYADNVKFWCKGSCWLTKEQIVKTSKSEREGRSGRMSIRDDPAKLTFTVTLEQLTEDDAGTYWCGIETYFLDPKLQVEVSVSPASRRSTPPATVTVTTTLTTTRTSMALTTQMATQGNSQPNLCSQVSIVHFWLPVFLKVPLLLSLLGAILWVSRPQRGLYDMELVTPCPSMSAEK